MDDQIQEYVKPKDIRTIQVKNYWHYYLLSRSI